MGRIFLGGFFWENFLGRIFGRIFLEEFFGRNFLVEINKKMIFHQDFGVILSQCTRKDKNLDP